MRRAFSLIELVIVIVVIGIIAAIAIPRMSSAAVGSAESALTGDLTTLRKAIELYRAEHADYIPPVSDISDQLLLYSNADGSAASDKKDTQFFLGRYLVSIPTLPVGVRAGTSGISDSDDKTVGWIYDEKTGTIVANCLDSELDRRKKPYNTY